MRNLAAITAKTAILLLSLVVLFSCDRQPLTLCVLETTDLHGAMGRDMGALAGYIQQMRKEYGKRLLLFDAGDNIQGTGEVFYANYIDTTHTHAFADIFNWLHYNALIVGNHEIEEGKPVYERFYEKMTAPVVCANIVDEKTRKPLFKPFVTFRRNGYKIAVLGLVSAQSLQWLPKEARYGAEFIPITECIGSWVQTIYKEEKPDVLIGVFHSGCKKEDTESAAWIVENVEGIHLICCGHTHEANAFSLCGPKGDTIHIIEAGAQASHIAKAVLTLTPNGREKPQVAITTQLIAARDLPSYPPFEAKTAAFLQAQKAYYEKPISFIDSTIYSRDAVFGPGVWTDILHRAYKEMALSTGIINDEKIITIVSPSSRNAVLEKGFLTLNDFIAMYPHENTLTVVEMNGTEIQQYLEYTHSLAIDKPDAPTYHFDSASGIRYRVHRHRPYGQRVEILGMSNGEDVYSGKYYRVAMTTFRALGGGGHLKNALGWTPQKMLVRTISTTTKGIRSLMVDYYQNTSIDTTSFHQWEVVDD